MRILRISAALVLLTATVALAGLPDPSRTVMGLSEPGTPCHYRFRMDGGFDRLTVSVTLRDQFDSPIPNCTTSVTLTQNAGTIALGTCCPNPRAGHSDPGGVIEFVFDQIGGRGSLDVVASVFCLGHFEVARESIDFTSPDLDASGGGLELLDLGLWISCYPPGPYCVWSDYNCDGVVNTLDLGLWAGGLGLACGQTPCP